MSITPVWSKRGWPCTPFFADDASISNYCPCYVEELKPGEERCGVLVQNSDDDTLRLIGCYEIFDNLSLGDIIWRKWTRQLTYETTIEAVWIYSCQRQDASLVQILRWNVSGKTSTRQVHKWFVFRTHLCCLWELSNNRSSCQLSKPTRRDPSQRKRMLMIVPNGVPRPPALLACACDVAELDYRVAHALL